MIKMKIKGIEQIFEINAANSYFLVVENQKYLRQIVLYFQNKDQENILFSKDYSPIDFFKKVLFLPSLSDIDYNNKKLLTQLYSELSINGQNYESKEIIDKLNILINQLLMNISEECPYAVDYEDTIDLTKILTISNFKLCDDNNQTMLERIIIYIKLKNQISPIKLLVLLFADCFFNVDELNLLVEEMNLLDICLIIISGYDRKNISFSKIIIDEDLCEL